jgi:RNA polymerase sigma factor (sigma-70 family)
MNATRPLDTVVSCLRRAVLRHDDDAITDGELLEQYVRHRDEAAFEGLLRRHGPMVLGVCRRVLGNQDDAEDAFQATFLVLVRKAGAVVPRSLVGNFLYGVAHNTARKARALRGKRRARELKNVGMSSKTQPSEDSSHLQQLLDEELARLPENYRTAIVLCELQGRTIREAAHHLGWPQGTVAGRLARARALLAERLKARDKSLASTALAAVLARQSASACVPRPLVVSTMKAAAAFASNSTATAVSASVAALTEGVLKSMLLNKLKVVVAALLLTTMAIAGIGYFDGPRAAAGPEEKKKTSEDRLAEKKPGPRLESTWPVRATLQGHSEGVFSVAFSRDGKLLATASYDGTVRLWSVVSRKCLATLSGHEGKVHHAAFSPDGKLLATAGEDKTSRVWDVKRGVEIQKMVHADSVRVVAFTPDGKTLIAGGGVIDPDASRGELRRWDPDTGKEQPPFGAVPGKCVHDLALSKDGKVLVTANGNAFTIWDIDEKGQLKERCSAQAEESAFVYGMSLSADGKTLAITWDAKVYLYETATGKLRATMEKSYVGCWGPLILSPDGKTVAAAIVMQEKEGDWIVQRRSMIRTWDVQTGKVRKTVIVQGSLASMAFAPDGKTLAAGFRGGVRFPDGKTINFARLEEEKDGTVKLLSVK